jgi:transcriptional regulator with XRE-family HTH domain
MNARNSLLAALPYEVESGLTTLGSQLKIARLRRNLSLAEVAEKIGVSRYTVADAENGKPTTGIAVYAALLWAYGLIGQLTELADPRRDEEGAALALSRERARAGRARINNDF